MTITKKLIKDYVHGKLTSDEKWALRGLVVIYDMQTSDEQHSGFTKHNNSVGFSGIDGEFLTSLAKQYQARGFLTPKQMKFVYKKMPKYWKQIVSMMDYMKLFDIMRRENVIDNVAIGKYVKKLKGKAFMEAL